MKAYVSKKKQESLYYNIHDLISFQINREREIELFSDINQPYSYFQSEIIDSPEIILNIGKYKPDITRCDVIDHKIYVKDNYLYCSELIDQIQSSFEITGLHTSPTIINIYTKPRKIRHRLFQSWIAQNIFLRPIIDFKLMQKDVISLHAAGISRYGKAIVLSGRGGAYKTTLAMDFIRRHKYQFVGEDRLLIGMDGRVFAYPLHFRLFEYRLANMDTENYKRFDKIKYIFFNGIRHKETENIKDLSTLHSLYSVVKYNKTQVDYAVISKSDMISRIVKSQQMEFLNSPGFLKMSSGRMYEYFSGYAYRFPFSNVANYWNNYKKMLETLLDSKKYIEIYIPMEYNTTVLNDFQKIIEKEGI